MVIKFAFKFDLVNQMPSPSAFSKFILSVLKFLSILKFLRHTQTFLVCSFFMYTQNHFGTLKS